MYLRIHCCFKTNSAATEHFQVSINSTAAQHMPAVLPLTLRAAAELLQTPVLMKDCCWLRVLSEPAASRGVTGGVPHPPSINDGIRRAAHD